MGEGNALKLREVIATIEGIVVGEQIDPDLDVRQGVSADLMSDALRFGGEQMLLVTGLTNPQVIRTAEMIGIPALLFVRAKLPPLEIRCMNRVDSCTRPVYRASALVASLNER
jgi:hypothetical protein